MKPSPIHPQSLTREFYWVAHWFDKVLTYFSRINSVAHRMARYPSPSTIPDSLIWKSSYENLYHHIQRPNDPIDFLITDRSPFSAIYYAQNGGKLLEPLIHLQIRDLAALGIELHTCYLKVEESLLWSRIQDRLVHQSFRTQFNENSYKWMVNTLAFYDAFPWNHTLDNNGDLDTTTHKILQLVDTLCHVRDDFIEKAP